MNDGDGRKAAIAVLVGVIIAVLVGVIIAVLAYVGLSRLQSAGSRNGRQAARARRGLSRTQPRRARQRGARPFPRGGGAGSSRRAAATKILYAAAAGATIVASMLYVGTFLG